MCGFSHTCVVFTKHLDRSQVFGRNHTCVVFTTHMEVHVISGNSHTCVVFPKQPERSLKTHGHIYFKHMEVFLAPKHCSFTTFVFGTETCSYFFNWASCMEFTFRQYMWLFPHMFGFFPHVCGKIHILPRDQLCGFNHTGVFYCTYVWKKPNMCGKNHTGRCWVFSTHVW